MKKVLLIIVLYALFPTWGMSESLKIDVYRAKNLENKLNYRDSERAFKCLANGINLTTTSRFLNVMTELYGDSITHSFYNDSTSCCILQVKMPFSAGKYMDKICPAPYKKGIRPWVPCCSWR